MRRRRARGTWLPSIGSVTAAGDDDSVASGRQFFIDVPIDGTIGTILTPLTFDQPVEGEADPTTSTMADIVGSEYFLERIVGKCFAFRQPTSANNQAVLFGAGFFVARANDTSSGGGPDTPIGSASVAELRDNYSPLEVDTIRLPWIWRRTWLLGSSGIPTGVTAPNFFVAADSPASTMLYGSVADGPHIDAKTKRRVRLEERLFFVVSATTFPFTLGEQPAQSIGGYLDYRLFGQLRRATQRGVF